MSNYQSFKKYTVHSWAAYTKDNSDEFLAFLKPAYRNASEFFGTARHFAPWGSLAVPVFNLWD
jgi:hypothetical protein